MDIINRGDYILTDTEILDYIAEIIERLKLNPDTMSSGQFNIVLEAVNHKYFKYNDILSHDVTSSIDDNIIYNILQLYIYLCRLFNKSISIKGFSSLSGIDYLIIESWKGENINSNKYKIAKIINDYREDYIKDKLLDSNNIVGAIAVANHEYKWTQPTTEGHTTINILSGSELPGVLQSLNNKGLAVPLPDNVSNNPLTVIDKS